MCIRKFWIFENLSIDEGEGRVGSKGCIIFILKWGDFGFWFKLGSGFYSVALFHTQDYQYYLK